jgi:hypothetical protein
MRRLLSVLLLVACGCEEREPSGGTTSGYSVCDELGRAYAAALAEAKHCSAATGAACSVEVEDRLGCACSTFVSSANPHKLEMLRSLKSKWTVEMCAHTVGCVPTRCETVTRGECNGGRCQDFAR